MTALSVAHAVLSAGSVGLSESPESKQSVMAITYVPVQLVMSGYRTYVRASLKYVTGQALCLKKK